MPASLGGAVLKLRLDLSFGDPVDPQRIDYPTLLDDAVISLLGYTLENVIAEKAETIMALGDANTRDRDYGDIYLLSGTYALEGESLRNALQVVTEHRGCEVLELSDQRAVRVRWVGERMLAVLGFDAPKRSDQS